MAAHTAAKPRAASFATMGIRLCPWIFPQESTKPAATFVPPTSTPTTRLSCMYSHTLRIEYFQRVATPKENLLDTTPQYRCRLQECQFHQEPTAHAGIAKRRSFKIVSTSDDWRYCHTSNPFKFARVAIQQCTREIVCRHRQRFQCDAAPGEGSCMVTGVASAL
jgi:hypothetical protein